MITREEFEKALDTYRLCRRGRDGNNLVYGLYTLVRRGPTVEKNGTWEIPVDWTDDQGGFHNTWVGETTLTRMNLGAPYYEILVSRGDDRSEPQLKPWAYPS